MGAIFQDQLETLQAQQTELSILSFYHYAFSGIQQVFFAMGGDSSKYSDTFELLKKLTQDKVCISAFSL